MQLSLDVLDALRYNAIYIGGVLSEAKIPDNQFYNALWNMNPKYDITDDALIVLVGCGQISFRSVRPSKIISLEVGDSVEFNSQIEDIHLDTYTNDSAESFDYDETWTEEHSHTQQTDILAEIQASIKEKLGASYAGFSGEVETQLSAKLGANHSDNVKDSKGNSKRLSLKIPPYTETSFSQEHSISDVSQSIKMVCEIDASVCIDGKHYIKHFPSFESLTLYMRGGGGYQNYQPLDDFVKTRKFEKFDLDSEQWSIPNGRRIFTIEKQRISRNVRTGKIIRKDTEIKHGSI